jgi:ATP/maltotriose-dependent transcriptional regulator MalT
MLPIQRVNIHLLEGDFVGANQALHQGLASLSYPSTDALVLSGLKAWLSFLEGSLVRALAMADDVIEKSNGSDAPPYSIGRMLSTLVKAGIDLEHNRFASSRTLLVNAEGMARRGGPNSLLIFVLLLRVRLDLAEGDEEAAWIGLIEAQTTLASPSPAVRAMFALEQLRQHRELALHGGSPSDVLLPDRADTAILRARRALVRGGGQEARAILEDECIPVSKREHIERGVLLALASFDHDRQLAHVLLREALLLAKPEGFVRTLLEQGDEVSPLLRSLPFDSEISPYVDELIHESVINVSPLRRSTVAAAELGLSPRELTVVRYLSSRMSNHEMAEALFVSPNTLKSHIGNIYRKMGVSTRIDAVRTARLDGCL